MDFSHEWESIGYLDSVQVDGSCIGSSTFLIECLTMAIFFSSKTKSKTFATEVTACMGEVLRSPELTEGKHLF